MRFILFFIFLIINCAPLLAARIDTLLIPSKAMNKSIPNLVIVPENYDQAEAAFPVLYLLHGAGGDYTDWASKVPQIKTFADTHNMIIVCPDGGLTSWYLDSPIDPKMRYETYISKELIAVIDTKYKTNPNKKHRAISGLSMGGHGAFYLAFKHQDIWGAAGSMSGGLDLRPFPNNWDLPQRLGPYAEHQAHWEKNTVINMVYLLKGNDLKLIFDCGTSDFFYDANKRFHEKLLERNIPHDYIERPGQHNWEYWSNAIAYQLLFFQKFFTAQHEKS